MKIQFGVTIIDRSKYRSSILMYGSPPYLLQILNRFMYIFSTIEKVDNAITSINRVIITEKSDNLGDNDYSVEVTKDFITFDLLWDKSDDPLKSFFPLKIPNNDFIQILKDLKYFLLKYESCQIPGIIPESKLDTWSCVPNEYIKEDWWAVQAEKHKEDGA